MRKVHVDQTIRKYIVQLTKATRTHPSAYLGASPRGSVALFRTAQALAFVRGREYVVPDDVKALVPLVLGHRIIIRSDARLSGVTVNKLLEDVMNDVPVPVRRGD